MIVLKVGVNPAGLRPELLLAIMICERVYARAGHELVITSLNDSKHSITSLHYDGKAADFRTRQLSPTARDDIAADIEHCLGHHPDYDFVVEADHFHIEYQPKRGAQHE